MKTHMHPGEQKQKGGKIDSSLLVLSNFCKSPSDWENGAYLQIWTLEIVSKINKDVLTWKRGTSYRNFDPTSKTIIYL